MIKATENKRTQQHTDGRHEPWCAKELHEADEAIGGPIGCYSLPITFGRATGWLTTNDDDQRGLRLAMDWTPVDWSSLRADEAADQLGLLARLLAEVGRTA